MNVKNDSTADKKFVHHNNGVIPKKYKELDDKFKVLVQNPPSFDPKNKKEVLTWLRDMVFTIKPKQN